MNKIINIRSRWLNIDKIYLYALAAILILALSIGLIGLNKGLWNDEYYTVRQISHASLLGMLQELNNDVHPPLYYILLYFWAKINSNECFLRLLSLLLNIGTLGVVISWLKPYSRVASLIAGFYLATTPIMLRYSQELRGYSLLVLATALAFFYASRVISNPEKKRGYFGLTFSLTIAVSTHLVGVMVIPSVVAFIAIQGLAYSKKIDLVKVILSTIIPCLTFIYFNFFWLNKLENIKNTWWWMPSIDFHLISSTTKYLFGLSSLYLPANLIPLLAFIFFSLIAISLIFGNYKTSFTFLVATIIYWLQVIAYSIIDSPIFYYRTLLPSLVPSIAFLSLQIATISAKKIKLASIIFLTILGLVYTGNWLTNQAYKPIEENRQVARSIESQWHRNDLVLFYPDFIGATIDYYFNNIPFQSQIPILDSDSTEKIAEKINDKITISNQEIEPVNLFLVGLNMGVNLDGYNNLLSAIDSQIKQPGIVNLFLIKGHDSYFFSNDSKSTENFLATLDSQFGKRISYQDFSSYIVSRYQVQ
jgi:hypothetical protein